MVDLEHVIRLYAWHSFYISGLFAGALYLISIILTTYSKFYPENAVPEDGIGGFVAASEIVAIFSAFTLALFAFINATKYGRGRFFLV